MLFMFTTKRVDIRAVRILMAFMTNTKSKIIIIIIIKKIKI